jgi:hypothetical protein
MSFREGEEIGAKRCGVDGKQWMKKVEFYLTCYDQSKVADPLANRYHLC